LGARGIFICARPGNKFPWESGITARRPGAIHAS